MSKTLINKLLVTKIKKEGNNVQYPEPYIQVQVNANEVILRH